MTKIFLKILVAITFIGTVVVNYLANALPLNNITAGEVSDLYPNLFAPAGITFSIWGLIYLLLGLFVLYYIGVFKKKTTNTKLLDNVSKYFVITGLANISWIFSWHYQIIFLSLILILVILFCLIKIASMIAKANLKGKEYFFVELPFSVYFGWITVATIANVTVLLVSLNWQGFGLPEVFWAVSIIIIGAMTGLWRMLKDKSVAYGLVFVWAYTGIIIKHVSPAEFAGQYPLVIITAGVCAFIFFATAIYLLTSKK